jgi:hypothetical protein
MSSRPAIVAAIDRRVRHRGPLPRSDASPLVLAHTRTKGLAMIDTRLSTPRATLAAPEREARREPAAP